MAEAAAGPSMRLPTIFPGSWINGDFYIWIGHRDDHRAWDQLSAARDAYDQCADGVAAEAREAGGRAVGFEGDVTDEDQLAAAIARCGEEFGSFDVIHNNAGVALLGPSLDFPEDLWRRSLDVMATGVFFCCQVFGRQMIEIVPNHRQVVGPGVVVIELQSDTPTTSVVHPVGVELRRTRASEHSG